MTGIEGNESSDPNREILRGVKTKLQNLKKLVQETEKQRKDGIVPTREKLLKGEKEAKDDKDKKAHEQKVVEGVRSSFKTNAEAKKSYDAFEKQTVDLDTSVKKLVGPRFEKLRKAMEKIADERTAFTTDLALLWVDITGEDFDDEIAVVDGYIETHNAGVVTWISDFARRFYRGEDRNGNPVKGGGIPEGIRKLFGTEDEFVNKVMEWFYAISDGSMFLRPWARKKRWNDTLTAERSRIESALKSRDPAMVKEGQERQKLMRNNLAGLQKAWEEEYNKWAKGPRTTTFSAAVFAGRSWPGEVTKKKAETAAEKKKEENKKRIDAIRQVGPLNANGDEEPNVSGGATSRWFCYESAADRSAHVVLRIAQKRVDYHKGSDEWSFELTGAAGTNPSLSRIEIDPMGGGNANDQHKGAKVHMTKADGTADWIRLETLVNAMQGPVTGGKVTARSNGGTDIEFTRGGLRT